MSCSINDKIQAISAKYKELRTTDSPLVKRMAIDELRKTATEAEAVMQLNECAENSRRRRQIQDILNKCREIQRDINERMKEEIGNGGRGGRTTYRNYDPQGRIGSQSYSQEELSKLAVRSVIMREIRSSQLRIRPQEIQEIAAKMEKNLEVMKEIEQMVVEQGGDLERIDEYLEIAYENAEQANVELKEAKEIQHKTRLLKFRVAVSGFFGMLGYKILGLPGLFMGLFFGAKST